MDDVQQPKTVTITAGKYKRLVDAQRKLYALEAGGVDNWEGYHDSLVEAGFFDEEDDEEEES